MRVLMRNPDLAPRGVLPVLSGKLVLRNTDVAAFSLDVNGNDTRALRLDKGWGVQILDGAQVLASGPVTKIVQKLDGDTPTRTLTVEGMSDMVRLSDMVTIPNPATPDAQADAWTGEGAGETVIRRLISEMIGPDAPAAYRVPGLVMADDLARGKTVHLATRFKPLLDEVQAQALAAGLVVDVVQNGTQILVRFREGQDLTRAVRLSRHNGAVGEATLTEEAPTVTEVIVGGKGEGSARALYRKAVDAGPWQRRITRFEDKGSSGGSSEMQQAAKTALDEGGAKAGVTCEIRDTARLRFGRDFTIGDRVTIDLGAGASVSDVVQIAELSWDEHGREVKLQVGPTADES